jgi:antitoxin component of MazEF toxin-antitoxin module
MMICKLIKVGNTMAISVPAAYRRQLRWLQGEPVAIQLIESDSLQPVALRIWSIASGIHQDDRIGPKVRLT